MPGVVTSDPTVESKYHPTMGIVWLRVKSLHMCCGGRCGGGGGVGGDGGGKERVEGSKCRVSIRRIRF